MSLVLKYVLLNQLWKEGEPLAAQDCYLRDALQEIERGFEVRNVVEKVVQLIFGEGDLDGADTAISWVYTKKWKKKVKFV